ncbi:MAG: RNA polymerase sigma factor [Muribaculum sp.]|nr:RNA polymerase sigma factor [Muribaculum sp.]
MEKGTFQKLYETHYMRVYSYVMTLAGKQCLAEELTQETFYRAFTARSGFRREASEATWLCAIARNLFYDEMRRQSKCSQEAPDLNADSGIDVEGEAEKRDASCRIHRALQELEEPYRKVFELRIFGDLSFREVGAICGKTENWARVTYHRAKLKLQERMGIHGTEL